MWLVLDVPFISHCWFGVAFEALTVVVTPLDRELSAELWLCGFSRFTVTLWLPSELLCVVESIVDLFARTFFPPT